LKAHRPVRVDAVENFIRGLLATTDEQKQKFFTAAARLDKNYAPPHFRLGRWYWEKKNYRQAAEWLDKVPAESVHAREAAFFLGLSRYHLGDYAGAQTAFQAVAAAVPLNEVWNNLGAAQLRAGKPEAAAESFRKALEGDPTDPDYHFNLGYSLFRAGQYPPAAAAFQAALDRNPDDAPARLMLERSKRGGGGGSPAGAAMRMDVAERVKQNFEETAYMQLKAVLEKK
jgi:tetratricopeptide (TPR) repeat protein